MAYYPQLKSREVSRVNTDSFTGYDHNTKIRDGSFRETRNLSTREFPMLSTRPRRGKLPGPFTKLQGVIAKDALYWVDNGTLYANGLATGLTGLQTEKETQLVSMGAYILVFPDKKYLNTQKLTDFGSMGADWSYSGTATYTMCHLDGTPYENVIKGEAEPENPVNGAVWIDTAAGSVREYSAVLTIWTVIETVYTRVDFDSYGQIPAAFQEQDGVQISGMGPEDLNGSKILYAVGGSETERDYVVLVGIQEQQLVQEAASIRIQRVVPDMDYVCEAQNRLWGCFYGNDGTQNLNEIYCCALGDFRNWEQYLGLSTDSWRASRGSDGPWTGCINYLGTPTFFKENIIHQVTVSTTGAHRLNDLPARGVQKGSHRSLAIVGETLYYKSRSGVVAYQGGMPLEVSSALGGELYWNAAGGAYGQRYYISMQDKDAAWQLFCYDAARDLWMHEDGLQVEHFAQVGDELYAQNPGAIWALNGTDGQLEGPVEWLAESGVMYYEHDKKYVSRFSIRLMAEKGATMQVSFQYDSTGPWHKLSRWKSCGGTGSVLLPVRPRRCDHMRMRLEGTGAVKLFCISRLYEKGSDA